MKKKKDILFLCQYFYPEYVSSATLPYDTAKAFVKAGFTVSVLCGYPNEYNKNKEVSNREIHNGIEIHRLKYLQLNRNSIIGRLLNYFSFTFAVFLRFMHLRNYKSIIVYSNPPVLPLIAAWASKFFGTKMVFVSYDVYPEMAHVTKNISENGIISKLMSFINRRIYKYVSKVVALSNEMKEYLIEHREQLEFEQVNVIPNWYDEKLFKFTSNSNLNEKFSNFDSKNNLVVSYFGNMGICQDMDTIINAIRLLKSDNNIKFLFAGHGNKISQIRSVIKEEGLENVIMYDFLHGKDFQDALNISDCFIVSLADGLTGLAVPSKIYSYMMAGKPVIAIMGLNSDISRDLLENNAGYVIEVGGVSKLVSSINELKVNYQLRETMGVNINKIFKEKYTMDICTQLYVDMMKNILEE